MADKLTKMQRRKNMQAVKSKGSKIEMTLAKALWAKGYRYRKNDINVFGKPDLTFKRYKIAIFVDGDFWHGRNWGVKKKEHKTNVRFWIEKIEKNIARDKLVNFQLLKSEWNVLRFWGSEIQKDLKTCILKIEREINETKRKNKH